MVTLLLGRETDSRLTLSWMQKKSKFGRALSASVVYFNQRLGATHPYAS